MDRAELKARARAQLGGGIFQNLWMMGLAVCLLIGLLESAAAGIIPGIGALLVVGPLEYGMAYIFLKPERRKRMLPSFDNDPHFPPVCPIFGHTGVCVC